jgi:hypothetical protein
LLAALGSVFVKILIIRNIVSHYKQSVKKLCSYAKKKQQLKPLVGLGWSFISQYLGGYDNSIIDGHFEFRIYVPE